MRLDVVCFAVLCYTALIFYYPPCILLFQSEFSLSLSNIVDNFNPWNCFEFPNETKVTSFSPSLDSRFSFLDLKIKKKKKRRKSSDKQFYSPRVKFSLNNNKFFSISFLKFYSGRYILEIEGKREQTIIIIILIIFLLLLPLLHLDIPPTEFPNSTKPSLPLPSPKRVSTRTLHRDASTDKDFNIFANFGDKGSATMPSPRQRFRERTCHSAGIWNSD